MHRPASMINPLMWIVSFGLSFLIIMNVAPPLKAAPPGAFVVVDTLVPILKEPARGFDPNDADKSPEDEGLIIGQLVYGNLVDSQALTGDFQGSVRALMDPKSKETVMGYIPEGSVAPLPSGAVDATGDYLVTADTAELTLIPGNTEDRLSLSSYGFALFKGEIVTAVSKATVSGDEYILFSFETNEGEGGLGERYAWGRSSDFMDLSSYQPQTDKMDTAFLPAYIRTRPLQGGEPGALDTYRVKVSDELKSKIQQKGFWIDPEPLYPRSILVDELADLYLLSPNFRADFITTDLFFHAYALMVPEMLTKLDVIFFSPRLRGNMIQALDEMENIHPLFKTKEGKAAFESAWDFFTITLALLGDVRSPSPEAKEEIKRIEAANQSLVSHITGAVVDYGRFKVPAHYLKLPETERFYRALYFLGRTDFEVFDQNGEINLPQLRTITLIATVLRSLGGEWESFEDPLNQLMAHPRGGGGHYYFPLMLKYIAQFQDIEDDAKLSTMAREIQNSPPSPLEACARLSVSHSPPKKEPLSILGRPFSYQHYVMRLLSAPNLPGRPLPKGLDLMKILGSPAADMSLLGEMSVKGYPETVDCLKKSLSSFFASDISYRSSFIYVLEELFKDSGSSQFFYKSFAKNLLNYWSWKKLETASALISDMYISQDISPGASASYPPASPKTAGNFAPPLPRGYVEPEPQVFLALTQSIDHLHNMLTTFQMEAVDDGSSPFQEYTQKLSTLKQLSQSAGAIAQKEIKGEPLTAEDYKTIKSISQAFNSKLLIPGAASPSPADWEALRMATVTPLALSNNPPKTLYAATGTPRRIFVYVNDPSGGPRLTIGYTYSYYEFTQDKA
ncbi:MAG: DUF3160 domain-containing protein, partial [Deltaproteobacteria bacterium]|nr:DUF3160 domain-containing protein [Deltaproteobacteria bacterium]